MSTKRLKAGRLWLGAVVALAWTLPGSAQVLKPIDPNKAADIDRKFIDPGVVGLKTLLQPTNTSSGRVVPQKTLGFSRVETKWMDTETLRRSTISTDTHSLTRSNFSAKRAVVTDSVRDEKTLDYPNAPIKDRTIRAFTPMGQEELKRQLHLRY